MRFPFTSPGRLLYLGYHLPVAKLRDLVKDGGPRQRRLTELGRLAMIDAASRLPSLDPVPEDAPRVHFLTGSRYWHQTAFFLVSLHPHLPVRPVIHDDGTLAGAPADALRRLCPSVEIITDSQARERLDRVLPASSFPRLRARRDAWVLFRKILDVHAGETGWNLFLDSDQLCFRRPSLLADWLGGPDSPLHMTDVGDAYGCPLAQLDAIAGRPVPRRVNTGILGLRSDAIDWQKMEWFCEQLDACAHPHYYHEQALVALWLAGASHRIATPLEDYVVLPNSAEGRNPGAVWHHYVAHSKRWYCQHRWRDFAPSAQNE